MERWGKDIGEAGSRPLSTGELERLQRIVIGDARLIHLGLREEGGVVGMEWRRRRGLILEDISGRPEDLKSLVEGIVAFDQRAVRGGIDPVVVAASIAFGFVYVHPFEDGNGRLHRWLIHHALANSGYNPAGLVFPVSAAILRQIEKYQTVLESYSRPLLDFIVLKAIPCRNVLLKNYTANYYRYFDSSAHVEFLFT